MAGVSNLNMFLIQNLILKSLRKQACFHILPTLLLVLQFLPVKTLAAPFPGMGSSKLTSKSGIIQIHQKGFQISTPQPIWSILPNETDLKNEINFNFLKEKTNATFSLKTETLNSPLSLEVYSKKWIREYASFGFDLLGTKPYIQNQAKALVIDLFHKNLNKKIRQVIFIKEKISVIMTCTDQTENFEKTLPECNSIFRTFQWN